MTDLGLGFLLDLCSTFGYATDLEGYLAHPILVFKF